MPAGRHVESKPIRNLDTLDYERRERLALLKLTAQEKKLCDVFVQTMDWEAAMREAGYAMQYSGEGESNYQKDVTHNYGHFERVVTRQGPRDYILLLKESVLSRLDFSLDDVIEEFRRLAFVQMSDFYEWDKKGVRSIKPSSQLTDAQRSQIMEISETTGKYGTTVKIKLFPKQPALDRLYEILKDLQSIEEKKKRTGDAPLIVDKRQVNVFLQDPVKRRAIEHMAEGMFGRRILLTLDDKKKKIFEQQMDKVVGQYMEATNDGVGRRGFIENVPGGQGAADRSLPGGDGLDGGDGRDPDAYGLCPQHENLPEGDEEGEYAGNENDDEQENGSERYPDVDGL